MKEDYLNTIKLWSETYYSPITMMPEKLQRTVSSLYLSLRAIDEIEDSIKLSKTDKTQILTQLIESAQMPNALEATKGINKVLSHWNSKLEDVSLKLTDWISLCPHEMRFRVLDCTLSMAERMLPFIHNNWSINSQDDLANYFYAVAGTPGLCLSDIWQWHEGKTTTRQYAISFGYFLQSINVLRGLKTDSARGISFFPYNWNKEDMLQYGLSFQDDVKNYLDELKEGVAYETCKHLFEYSLKVLDEMQISYNEQCKP